MDQRNRCAQKRTVAVLERQHTSKCEDLSSLKMPSSDILNKMGEGEGEGNGVTDRLWRQVA